MKENTNSKIRWTVMQGEQMHEEHDYAEELLTVTEQTLSWRTRRWTSVSFQQMMEQKELFDNNNQEEQQRQLHPTNKYKSGQTSRPGLIVTRHR